MKLLPEISKALAQATTSNAALARENAELSSVFGAMREGVIAITRNQHVTRINEAAAQLLGITPEKARGRLLGEVLRHSEVSRTAREALEGREAFGEAELLTSSADGEIMRRTFQIHGEPLPGRDGAALVLHDVSQLRRLEMVRQDFVANASHEIRTPVAAIQAAIETMNEAPDLSVEDRARFMGILSRQSLRLSAIVEDLLSLSRLERGQALDKSKLEKELLKPILESAIEACAQRALAASVRLELSCDASLFALVDPSMIERAAINLLENAIKYGGSGGVVFVNAKTENQQAVIEVKDLGQGIPSEHLPRIFERFYRTDKARSRELGGTGLGLSIVKHIAEAHGGKIAVDSHVGYGSTFRIYLPL